MEKVANKFGGFYNVFKKYADAEKFYNENKHTGNFGLHPNPAEAWMGGLEGYVVRERV
jgi:hypothetical protein